MSATRSKRKSRDTLPVPSGHPTVRPSGPDEVEWLRTEDERVAWILTVAACLAGVADNPHAVRSATSRGDEIVRELRLRVVTP